MHADQRIADVDPGVRTHFLDRYRVLEVLPAGRRPAAARMWPRADRHDLISVPKRTCTLHDHGTVQMLTALRREIDALFLQHRRDALIHRIRDLHTADLPDVPAEDLTRRTAHHKHTVLAKLRLLQQLTDHLRRLSRDFM